MHGCNTTCICQMSLFVVSVESECFELTVMKGQAEGGKFSSTKVKTHTLSIIAALYSL